MIENYGSGEVSIGTKRPKIDICTNESGSSSLLGLTLTKSPSFAELIEQKLSKPRATDVEQKIKKNKAPWQSDKLKASNIPALSLEIGSWKRVASYEVDLVAKCYFGKQKLVWEVLNEGLKSKMEIQWPQISAIRATFIKGHHDSLEIELEKPPSYFCESSPQPKKHTMWINGDDFTGGQALIYKGHILKFSEGTLKKHYEKLLQCDYRLYELSHMPFPNVNSTFFDYHQFPCQIPLVGSFCNIRNSTQLIMPHRPMPPTMDAMNSDCWPVRMAMPNPGNPVTQHSGLCHVTSAWNQSIRRTKYIGSQRTEQPMLSLEINSIAHQLLGEPQPPAFADEKSLLVKVSSFGSALCELGREAQVGSTLEEEEHYIEHSNALAGHQVYRQVCGVHNLSGSSSLIMEAKAYNDCDADQIALLQYGERLFSTRERW